MRELEMWTASEAGDMHALARITQRACSADCRASDSVDLGWGLRMCVSSKFPDANIDVPGTAL